MPSSPRTRAMLAVVIVLTFTASAITAARAASMLDFDVWMRAIDRHSVDVQKNIEARRPDAAIADAQELARLYALMARYFVDDSHATDAVEMSRSGQALAEAIPPAIAARRYEAAASAALEISHACNDCHDVHKPFQ